jgi:hypothetical protein
VLPFGVGVNVESTAARRVVCAVYAVVLGVEEWHFTLPGAESEPVTFSTIGVEIIIYDDHRHKTRPTSDVQSWWCTKARLFHSLRSRQEIFGSGLRHKFALLNTQAVHFFCVEWCLQANMKWYELRLVEHTI